MQGQDMLDFASRFIRALESADIATVRDCYHQGAGIWHNTDDKLQTVEDNIKSLVWMHKKLSKLRYDIKKRTPLADGFVQQHVLRGLLNTGESYALQACVVVKVSDYKISLIEEYIDSAEISPLLASA